ncbi:hypothetical protein [Cohnella zeiphila]|uniref:Uncharacterized protein n=1 Tax=Cohnella zeiphila TaxID=2761120 RepID=A0A7X0VWJ6_9BACL|nr:hypothetical protein [Cohnella zeiphila]MBB6731018.1 hypothetical protein [Cohnella zeiphila]
MKRDAFFVIDGLSPIPAKVQLLSGENGYPTRKPAKVQAFDGLVPRLG